MGLGGILGGPRGRESRLNNNNNVFSPCFEKGIYWDPYPSHFTRQTRRNAGDVTRDSSSSSTGQREQQQQQALCECDEKLSKLKVAVMRQG